MSWVDQVSRWAGWALRHLARGPDGPLILMYHGVGGEDGIPPAALDAHLELLAGLRTVVPLRDAVAALGTERASSLASVTFDDGYVDFAELALPILEARRCPATLFVPAGHIGGWNRWDEGRAPRRAILGEQALRALPADLVEVGAHGWSHIRLRGLSEAALERETRDARRRLEDVVEREVALFAYPYGQLSDFDSSAIAAVRKARLLAACSTHFGRGSLPLERYHLRRVAAGRADHRATLIRKLRGSYDWIAAKERAALLLRKPRSVFRSRGARAALLESAPLAPRGSVWWRRRRAARSSPRLRLRHKIAPGARRNDWHETQHLHPRGAEAP